MLQRTITGAIFVAVLIGCIVYNQYTFIGLFFVINFLGLREFYKLTEKTGHAPQAGTGIALGGLIYLAFAFYFDPSKSDRITILILMALPILFLSFIIELFRKKQNPFGNIAYMLLGIVYVTVPISLMSFIAFYADGCEGYSYYYERILGIFFCLWANDTGAYLSGKYLGKHKLFERVSPNKTWEGCIGGALLSYGVAVLISQYFTTFSIVDWLVIATILIVIGTLGDLVESLLKRSIDVKDSGNILPGHGGILDRFDSFLLAIPFIVTYILISCH